MRQKKLLIAHRGLSATYPENTLPAFEAALNLEVDGIEFDVRMTRDRVPVLSHEEQLIHCGSGVQGKIGDFTFDELRKFDFGRWKAPEFAGTRIPTLVELLDLVDAWRSDLFLCVELKENDCECARMVIDELKRRKRLNRCSIISFCPEMLYYVHGLDEHIFLHGFLEAPDLDSPAKQEYIKIIRRVGIYREKLSREFSDGLHARGIEVDSWTADTPEELRRMLDCDVDTITSNAPDRIIGLLKK